MDMTEACSTVRESQTAFQAGARPRVAPIELELAVQTIRRHLESERPDGCPIRELAIDEHLLFTRTGVNYVMPFVLHVERRPEAELADRAEADAPASKPMPD